MVRAGGAGGGWRLCEGLGSLPEKGPAAFCRAGPQRQSGGQGLTALLGEGPRSAPRRAVVGLAPFSDGNLAIISTSLVLAKTCPRVHASVHGDFWKNFLVFVREGVLGGSANHVTLSREWHGTRWMGSTLWTVLSGRLGDGWS